MPIKNYTSQIKPSRSLGKIQAMLAEHGATNVSMEYEGGKPVALEFKMRVGEITIPFRLTVDVDGMLRAMKRDKKVPAYCCNYDQAEMTAWKNKLEWLHLQLTEIESNQARIEQLLLGYAVTSQGDTVFEMLKNNNKLLSE